MKLAEATLEAAGVLEAEAPEDVPLQPVVADRGYDSDPLREALADRGVQLIAPHRKNRKAPPTQDEAGLESYKRRWKVERTFAWLGNYRRLLVRHDRYLSVYQGFFHLACLLITLRYF